MDGPPLSVLLWKMEKMYARYKRVRLWMTVVALFVVAGTAGFGWWRSRADVMTPLSGPIPSVAQRTKGHSTTLPGWTLVWEDDFTNPHVTARLWNFMNWRYPYNGQLESYSSSNLQDQGGMLHIAVKPNLLGIRPYTSGMITTWGKFSLKYGLVVVRARLPAGQGLFPAIWMVPATSIPTMAQSDIFPEIDIMENVGRLPNKVFMTLHYQAADHSIVNVGAPFTGPNFTQGFHTFALKWTPTSLVWMVDGVPRETLTTDIPIVREYLIINVAVGGQFPGNPTSSDHWPQQMLVKYVRIYKQTASSAPTGEQRRTH